LSAAIENGMEDIIFEDNGEFVAGNKTFRNSGNKAHGTIDLKKAYAVSSNVAFMQLGEQLTASTVKEYMKKFGIGDKIPFDISVANSRFDYGEKLGKGDFAQLCIGQGRLLVTPMQMALMTSVIANDGVMPKPYLVSKVTNSLGITVESTKPQLMNRVLMTSTANKVADYMQNVVDNGTGYNARISGVEVAGKTGTAENEIENKEHTWFIGFAPKDNPTIAVAVICEYSGKTGGTDGAPVAAALFKEWLVD